MVLKLTSLPYLLYVGSCWLLCSSGNFVVQHARRPIDALPRMRSAVVTRPTIDTLYPRYPSC
jgi:hypothetical protein